MSNIPLLLFSGGADSTVRLNHLLDFTNVDVLYASAGQCPLKIAREKQARRRIIKLFTKRCRYSVEDDIDLTGTLQVPHNRNISYAQMPAWFVAALCALNPYRHSRVEICYVLGDSAIGEVHNLQTAWSALVAALFPGTYEKGVLKPCSIPLEFPLRQTSKKVIYATMEPEIRRLIWVCETPLKRKSGYHKPCGKCPACVTQRHTDEIVRADNPRHY